jgi:hypothetical protein
MKTNLEDTTDIVREIEPAPANKQAMLKRKREIAGPQAVFQNPIVSGKAVTPYRVLP